MDDSALPLITGTPSLSVTTIAWRPSTLGEENKQYFSCFLLQWLNTTHYELTPRPHQHVTSCIHTSAAVCTGISSNPAKKTSFLLRFSRKLCAARTLYTPHICDFLFVFLKYKHFIMCFSLRDREGQGWPLRERQKDRQTVRETDRPHSHQPW